MSKALQTIHRIKRATTDLRMWLGSVVFLRGPLRGHVDALEDLWSRLQAGLLKKRFTRYRLVSHGSWTTLPESRTQSSFSELFAMRGPLVGQWGLELAEPGDDSGNQPTSIWLQLSDLAPVRGMERASHLRVLFPDETPVATVAALGEWAIDHLPLWWGSAGFVFQHTSGTLFTAHMRIAALAKRYWGVQIQDMTALQWDALLGMPGVNWLTLIGNEFAQSGGTSIDQIVTEAGNLTSDGVFHRSGPYSIALAAGPKPQKGDINIGEDLAAYVRVASLLKPLLLNEHTPLSGPFADPEIMVAWLRRFSDPKAWLNCNIGAD